MLEDALEQYPGAVVVVTHDRSLMARLATRILEVNAGRVTLYPGGYDDYESTRLAREAAQPGPATGAPAKSAPGPDGRRAPAAPPAPAPRPAPRRGAGTGAEPGRARAERQKREREVARIEKDIEARESKVAVLGSQLADPDVYHDGARAKELVTEYERLRAEIESLWQRLGELG